MNGLLQRINMPLSRFALFLVYFWFGLLKVVGESPATPMVQSLFNKTIAPMVPSLSFDQFIILFGVFEMIIGLLFLLPRFEKLALVLAVLHIFTTALPLLLLKDMVWIKMWVPTLEGQYIFKNILILSLAISVFVNRRL